MTVAQRRQRDKEAFARFMAEWQEAIGQVYAKVPLCHLLASAGPESDPKALKAVEGLEASTNASNGQPEASTPYPTQWSDSHLKAHGMKAGS